MQLGYRSHTVMTVKEVRKSGSVYDLLISET